MEAVYIIHLREFINAEQSVYKIGRTSSDHTKRANSYPKQSILKIQINVVDSRSIEKIIILMFTQCFKQRTDIGTEYFEGSYDKMQRKLLMIINECKSTVDDSVVTINNAVATVDENLDEEPTINNNKTCPTCRKTFTTNASIKFHLARQTPCVPPELNNNIIIKKYKCHRCDSTFQTSQNLNTHINRKYPCI